MLSALIISSGLDRFGDIERPDVEFARPPAQGSPPELAKVLDYCLVGTAALAGGFDSFGACRNIDAELPCQFFETSSNIHGVADNRIFEPIFGRRCLRARRGRSECQQPRGSPSRQGARVRSTIRRSP